LGKRITPFEAIIQLVGHEAWASVRQKYAGQQFYVRKTVGTIYEIYSANREKFSKMKPEVVASVLMCSLRQVKRARARVAKEFK
jgi:hypothetical protein